MDGAEMPLPVIVEHEKPRWFKHLKFLPYICRRNKSKWITCRQFVQFLMCGKENGSQNWENTVAFRSVTKGHGICLCITTSLVVFLACHSLEKPLGNGKLYSKFV
jgi:hypothetical protein